MALFTILRRTASSVIPRSIRSIATQRNYSSAILKNTNSCFSQRIIPRTFSPILNFSSLSTQSNSDYKLVKILDSEIDSAEEEGGIELDEIPDWFPFEIKDDPGKQTIILGSNYQGEDIKVVVHMPGPVEEGEKEEEEEEDGDNNESNEESVQTCISMIVSVAKGRNEPCLEFGCTVYPDEIIIDSLSVKDPDTSEDDLAYEGPDFSDLDENLQNAFHKYLEVRGIKPSTTNFLYEYMSNKESKEYLNWLKNVKYFVEK